jgi:hypothetical protein
MLKVVKSLVKRSQKLMIDSFILEKFSAERLPHLSNPERYQLIFETDPLIMPVSCNLELHMLVCERDYLRSFWSLKSFFYYSGLRAKLVLQNDGSLSPQLIDCYHEHFPGCVVNTNVDEEVRAALTGYPMCQFFLEHHAIAKKLFHPLLLANADRVLIMDSDILWFKPSKTIDYCVDNGLPFYVDGGCDGAYVRNQKFMKDKLGLFPANNVNSGIVGYQRSKFLDLKFIEAAIQKLVHIPKELLLESVGYDDGYMDINSEDINQTLCWWVMEQTIYALLLGREPQRKALESWSNNPLVQLLGDLYQFTNTPIMRGTSLIHYISDAKHDRFFPVGVEHLIKRGFLEKLSQSSK